MGGATDEGVVPGYVRACPPPPFPWAEYIVSISVLSGRLVLCVVSPREIMADVHLAERVEREKKRRERSALRRANLLSEIHDALGEEHDEVVKGALGEHFSSIDENILDRRKVGVASERVHRELERSQQSSKRRMKMFEDISNALGVERGHRAHDELAKDISNIRPGIDATTLGGDQPGLTEKEGRVYEYDAEEEAAKSIETDTEKVEDSASQSKKPSAEDDGATCTSTEKVEEPDAVETDAASALIEATDPGNAMEPDQGLQCFAPFVISILLVALYLVRRFSTSGSMLGAGEL